MIAKIVRPTIAVGMLVAQGCVSGRVVPFSGTGGDWPQTLAQAEAAALDRRYADADRLLADFATRYPGTDGAIESAYWRGVFALEPGNQVGSPAVAAALFETYAKSPGALPHRLEAEIFRRVALRVQSLSPATAVATSVPSPAVAPPSSGITAADLRAKDAEIQRLKDELAKANDELDRIKKRLTAPTKPQ